MTGERHDVAIAGGGLAGGSLALRLARAGLRVVLLDASAFPREKLCGEFLSPECWGVLRRLGLDHAVREAGYEAIGRMRLTTPSGRVLEASIPGAETQPGIGMSRGVLDHLIVAEAAAAGVDVVERARVTGPWIEGGRVVGVVGRHARARGFRSAGWGDGGGGWAAVGTCEEDGEDMGAELVAARVVRVEAAHVDAF